MNRYPQELIFTLDTLLPPQGGKDEYWFKVQPMQE